MSQTTYLDYTCAPNPLMQGATQDIVIIATLKTAIELGDSLASAIIDQIVLDFGEIGTGATNLTQTAFIKTSIEVPPNWNYTVSGAICTLTPTSGHGEISTNAIIVKIKNVVVNASLGNVTLAIKEDATPATQTNSVPSKTSTINSGNEKIIIPKVEAGKTALSFVAVPASISAGNSTTLNWSGGSDTDLLSLLYLSDGNLKTIEQHSNGTKLGPNDTYPNLDLVPADPVLVLNSSTTFILQIQKVGGAISHLATAVIVSQSNLYANNLTVAESISADNVNITGGGMTVDGQVNVGGPMIIGDDLDNGVIYIPQINQGGFYFRTGNTAKYVDLATLDNQGNLQVNGTITANKFIQTSGSFMTNETLKSVGGWAGGLATYTTGSTASTGGITLGSIEGFSLTDGNGNYGYYSINLGSVVEGILTVDMYITNQAVNGMGFWHIISSANPIGPDNKFNDITTTYQIWSEYQNPSWGLIHNNAAIIRKKISINFYGQYIYIGATDQLQGRLGIKINNVSATPLH